MSYDLLVWEGPRPADDVEAAEVSERLMALVEADDAAPPTEVITEFVDQLLRRWPDITKDTGEVSPWADGPMIGNASGSMIYFSMVFSMADEASAFAAELAQRLGLQCFDPQLEQLRPARPRARRRWWWRGTGSS